MVHGGPVACWLLGWGNIQARPREEFGGFLERGNWSWAGIWGMVVKKGTEQTPLKHSP